MFEGIKVQMWFYIFKYKYVQAIQRVIVFV